MYQFAAKKRSQKRLGREMSAASFSSEGVSVARICNVPLSLSTEVVLEQGAPVGSEVPSLL